MDDKDSGTPNAADAYCPKDRSANCAGCGDGGSTCDERCIRKAAAMKCSAAHNKQPDPIVSDKTKGSCSPKAATSAELAKVADCCSSKESGCSSKKKTIQTVGDDKQRATKDDCSREKKEQKEKQDGCCGPNKGGCCSEQTNIKAKEQEEVPKKEGCCAKVSKGKDIAVAQKTDCCAPKKDSCCSPPKDTPDTKQADSCCSPKQVGDCSKEDDKDIKPKGGCCAPKKDSNVTTVNCKEIDIVDEIEDVCYLEENNDCCATNAPKGAEKTVTEACKDHLQQAFIEYSSYLEKGLCICRDALTRFDTCVIPSGSTSDLPTADNSSAASSALATPSQATRRRTGQKSCQAACCGPKPVTEIKAPSGCPADKIEAITSQPPRSRAIETDVENAAARQHVFLSIAGMTCTGCSRKLANVLNNIDGISSVEVTFVTGVAEFDLDPSISELQNLLPRIEKETGFKCSRIASEYQTLDLRIDLTLAEAVLKHLGKIVESVEKVDKSTYRVSYDPAVTGARDLLSPWKGITLAPPANDAKLADSKKRLINMAWATGVAAVLTIPIVVLNWSENLAPYLETSVVSLVLATFVQAIAVPEFYLGAFKSLVYSRVIEMDMLIVISITAAYLYSIVAFSMTHAGYVLETGEFFETSSLLITLVLLGRLLAAIAKLKAVSAVSMRSLQAEKALLVEDSETVEIDARLLQLGDAFVVPAHSLVVTDGIIIDGQGSIDESMITGESVPVPKQIGDTVIAGTINGPSPLTVRLTRLPGKNSITDIAGLVESALAAKPRIQDLADKVAGYFIPVVVGIAAIIFGIWMGVAIKIRGQNGGSAVGTAITYSIAVLAVSCPCALGLAVPMVLVIAGGVAARSGIIIKQADAIERGHQVTDVVFDKTGTITKGDLTVVHEELFSDFSEEQVRSLARLLTKENSHPVSVAVATYLQLQMGDCAKLENVESIPGAGIQAVWNGLVVKAGNPYWLGIEEQLEVKALIEQGMSLFCITTDSNLLAAFGIKSGIRDEARQAIANLQRRKIQCHIVSGDGPRVVEDVATAVGIPLSNIASRHSPAQKQEYVKNLMSTGRKVLFCGDGTNDAVAVAQANVGVQIGTASDVTRGTADVVLLGGLDGVTALLDISKRASRRIYFNFIWSAVYNVFAILLAGGAFVRARIPPEYAGLGEIVSVLPVIIAAMTLSRKKHVD